MIAPAADAARILDLVLEAISARDLGRLEGLLDPGAVVRTGRAEHAGAAAVLAWAGRAYDHLERIYSAEQPVPAGDGYVARGAVEYRWREDGRLADRSPIWFSLVLGGERLLRLGLHDDAEGAGAELGA